MRLPIERAQLDGVLVFLRVAELRSFRAAAAQLGVSPSAVSQSIRGLEAAVGVPLLARTTRTVGLTEAGQRLLTHAKPAVDMLSTGIEAAVGLGEEVSGLLRLNVPRQALPFLANRLLPDFLTAYPAVQLELFGEDRLIDIVEHGFDAGLRFGERVEADMVAVVVTPPLKFGVVGTPAYFREHGHPATPKDLQRHKCIQLRMQSQELYNWEFVVGGRPVEIAVKGPLIVNDGELNLRAALMGLGLAYVPVAAAMCHIANGQLETTLDAFSAEEPGLMLYYPSRAQTLPKLRAFVDFARTRLRRDFDASDYVMAGVTTGVAQTGPAQTETTQKAAVQQTPVSGRQAAARKRPAPRSGRAARRVNAS